MVFPFADRGIVYKHLNVLYVRAGFSRSGYHGVIDFLLKTSAKDLPFCHGCLVLVCDKVLLALKVQQPLIISQWMVEITSHLSLRRKDSVHRQ